MLLRTACTLAATVFLLAACDGATSTESPNKDAGDTSSAPVHAAQHPSDLVGSWVAPAGDFGMAHMVLRADGSGATMGVSGTRRDVRTIRWSTHDSILVLTDSTGLAPEKVYHVRGDTLRFLTHYFGGRIDSIVFVREPEPSLVPSAGERAPALVGAWHGSARHISYTTYGGDVWVPSDTFWVPDAFRFQGDGTGMHLGYEDEYVCDTLPLTTPVTGDGFWDTLTTPDRCDPEYDGLCTYSAVKHCYETYLPTDTTRFTWWTSKGDLYLGMWAPGSASQTIVGTQVMGWSVAGDSLKIQAYYDSGLVQGYKRTP
jgi:hypothetical protein